MTNYLNPKKKIVSGYSRDLFMDFDDNSIQLLPKTFAEYLEIDESGFDEYDTFIEKKHIRISNTPNESMGWDSFSLITNSSIYVAENILPKNIVETCNLLIIESVELVFCKVEEKKIIDLLNKFNNTFVTSLELVFSEPNISSDFLNILTHHHLVFKITFLNQQESKQEVKNKEGVPVLINYSKKILNDFSKSDISTVNYKLFTESQKHHIYFNRKLYIGTKGEIKNAPECKEEFGKVQDLKNTEELKEIIATKEFQKYWYVHKEICDVCKDCEFRHMCVGNRLPYKRLGLSQSKSKEQWFHKTECNYNPYICKWESEEGYKTLAECGVVSDETGFSIDHEKIEKINHELWGE